MPDAPKPTPFEHGTNCGYHSQDGHDRGVCTCGLYWRIALQTEQEMHAAWRKRAEESEAETALLRASLAEAEKQRDMEKGWKDAQTHGNQRLAAELAEARKRLDAIQGRDNGGGGQVT